MHQLFQHLRHERRLPRPPLLKLYQSRTITYLKISRIYYLKLQKAYMPSVLSRIAELKNKFFKFAPKRSQEKIEKVLEIYKDRANLNFRTVQNMVLALYSPSLMGKDKVEKMYENFLSKYQDEEKYPTDWKREMTNKERLEERRDRLLGVRRTYQLSVILFTQEKKLDPTKKKDIPKQEALPTGTKKGDAMHLPKGSKTKRLQGLVQVARLSLIVDAYSSKAFELLKGKLATRGTKEFRQLYPICMTNKDFAEREKKVPGYIEGIYMMDWTAIGRHGQVLKKGPPYMKA